jgi:hypothetical protein
MSSMQSLGSRTRPIVTLSASDLEWRDRATGRRGNLGPQGYGHAQHDDGSYSAFLIHEPGRLVQLRQVGSGRRRWVPNVPSPDDPIRCFHETKRLPTELAAYEALFAGFQGDHPYDPAIHSLRVEKLPSIPKVWT